MRRRTFLAATAAALAAADMFAESAGPKALRLRRSRDGNLTSLDPHRPLSAVDMEIAADLFCGLTAIAADGSVIPGCASSWEVSADGLRWQFKLRSGLRWSDGSALGAADFVTSFRRLLDPSTAALLANRYGAIGGANELLAGRAKPEDLGVAAPDATTFIVQLAHPEVDLLKLLAIAYVVPAAAIKRWGRDWAKPPQMIVNGAFAPLAWDQGGSLLLARNPLFFDAASVGPQQLEWITGIDDATRLRLFRAGTLDVAQIAEGSQLAIARRELAPQLRSEPTYGGGWVGLQTQRPILRDLRVRRALAMSVDRRVLVDKVRALGESPSDSIVPDAVRDYPLHAKPDYAAASMSQRLELATRLMEEAGYTAARPAHLIVIFSANQLTQRSFLALAAMWQRIGARLEIRGLESRAYNVALGSGDFDLMDYAPFSAVQSATSFVSRFHSQSFLNYSRFANAEVDRLIDAAERQSSVERRAAQYLAAEQILLRDWPVIPLYSGMRHRLIGRQLLGWQANPGLSLPSRFLSLQEQK